MLSWQAVEISLLSTVATRPTLIKNDYVNKTMYRRMHRNGYITK